MPTVHIIIIIYECNSKVFQNVTHHTVTSYHKCDIVLAQEIEVAMCHLFLHENTVLLKDSWLWENTQIANWILKIS